MCLVYKSAYSNLILSSPEWVTWKSEKKKSGFSLHTDTSGLCTCPVWHSSVIPGLCFVAVETEPCLLKVDNFFFFFNWDDRMFTNIHTDTANLHFSSHESLLTLSSNCCFFPHSYFTSKYLPSLFLILARQVYFWNIYLQKIDMKFFVPVA